MVLSHDANCWSDMLSEDDKRPLPGGTTVPPAENGLCVDYPLAQIIVSAKQHLDAFEDLWREDPPRAGPELEKALDRLGRAVVETRLLLATLRPGSLTAQSLVPAVRALLEELGRREGWKTTLTAELGDGRLPATVEVAR